MDNRSHPRARPVRTTERLAAVAQINLLATAGDITLSWTSPIYPKLYANDSSINPLGRPITESEDSWLGSLVTIGATVGPFPYSFIGGRFGRRIGLLCVAVPHIVSYVTMAFATNIYLFFFARVIGGLAMGEVEKDKLVEAEKSLIKLRDTHKDGVQKELENIKEHMNLDEEGHFSDILRKSELRKALMISVVLIVAQAMSGYCAITFYLQTIFEEVGSELPPEISALIVGVVLLVSSFISPFLIDRLGRRILLVVSCFGTFLSLLMLGVYFYIQDSTDLDAESISFIPILSLMLYIIFINVGLGSIPWTLCSELFPSNVKQIAASVQSSACWLSTFLVTFLFNDMNDSMGRAGTFWFFSSVCLGGFFFSIFLVPETKGKSFREIQDMLKFGNRKHSLTNQHIKDVRNFELTK
ncbi:hypothetical protein NQ318_002663 [Aromia moschata]|uniref:Major facilitator superfamily (MFS) profile domain-containing protein n=1 Tax=Aromia moschata TaxID=1265417 RepID=A0AAV8XVR4_9CUCU|nr:hypothetical protein NQ318_002663 [Aromia moschata]